MRKDAASAAALTVSRKKQKFLCVPFGTSSATKTTSRKVPPSTNDSKNQKPQPHLPASQPSLRNIPWDDVYECVTDRLNTTSGHQLLVVVTKISKAGALSPKFAITITEHILKQITLFLPLGTHNLAVIETLDHYIRVLGLIICYHRTPLLIPLDLFLKILDTIPLLCQGETPHRMKELGILPLFYISLLEVLSQYLFYQSPLRTHQNIWKCLAKCASLQVHLLKFIVSLPPSNTEEEEAFRCLSLAAGFHAVTRRPEAVSSELGQAIRDQLEKSLIQIKMSVSCNISSHSLSQILYGSYVNPQLSSPTLKEFAIQQLRTARPSFTDIDDFLRVLQSLTDILSYLITESAKFIDDFDTAPDKLFYVLQTFAVLLPDMSQTKVQLDVFRPLTREELFYFYEPSLVDDSNAHEGKAHNSKFQDEVAKILHQPSLRRLQPHLSLRSAIGALGDCLKRRLFLSDCSLHHLLQGLQFFSIPSPLTKRNPKSIRRLVRRILPEIGTMPLHQLTSFFMSVQAILYETTPPNNQTSIPSIGWRVALRQQHKGIGSNHDLFNGLDGLLVDAGERLHSRLQLELYPTCISSPNTVLVTGSQKPITLNLGDYVLLRDVGALIQITQLLTQLQIDDMNLAAGVAKLLLENRAEWLKVNLKSDRTSLIILDDYFSFIKQAVEDNALSTNDFIKNDKVSEDQMFKGIGGIPIHVIVAQDVVQDLLDENTCSTTNA